MTLFLFGLTSGATVLTAQYWGKEDKKTIEKILALGMKAAIIVTAIFTVAALLIPDLLMQIFTTDPEVIAEGVKYLRIIAFSYVAAVLHRPIFILCEVWSVWSLQRWYI